MSSMMTSAFLIHPRDGDTPNGADYHDVERIRRVYGWLPFNIWLPIGWFTRSLRWFPQRNKILSLLPPLVTGRLYSSDTRKTVGWIITIPRTASQLSVALKEDVLPEEKKEKKQIAKTLLRAVKTGKKIGARGIGLGEMTAPVTGGGKTLSGKVEGIGITNGNALTVAVTIRGLKAIAKKTDVDLQAASIAIVGIGSVGKGIAMQLSNTLGKCHLVLVNRTKKKAEIAMNKIISENPQVKVEVSNQISAIKECDVVIVTTSGSDLIIKPEHLKAGAIVLDDTQPRNVSLDTASIPYDTSDYSLGLGLKKFLVVDGGILDLPEVRNTMDIGLRRETYMYACQAEVFLWTTIKQQSSDFAVSQNVYEKVEEIEQIFDEYGRFKLAPFTSFGKVITEEEFNNIRYVRTREQRHSCQKQQIPIIK